MKKFLLVIFCMAVMVLSTGCEPKPKILFNNNPITEENVLDYSNIFTVGQRIYYLILLEKKIQSRYIYIQVVKKDNNYGYLGYNLYWADTKRLSDEQVHYYTDYVVINEPGHYIMQVYSKDKPKVRLTGAEFYVEK